MRARETAAELKSAARSCFKGGADGKDTSRSAQSELQSEALWSSSLPHPEGPLVFLRLLGAGFGACSTSMLAASRWCCCR